MDLTKRKWRVWMAVVTLSALLGAWAVFHGGSDVQYRTAPVERGDVEASVSATGNLNAVVTVQVGSQVSGNIMALYADFNTKVKKGQLVARIDPLVFQAKVDQAKGALEAAKAAVVNARAVLRKDEAGLASARAALATARANTLKARVAVQDSKNKLDRRAPLFHEGVIAREDFETAQTAYDSAVAALNASLADERAAQDNVAAALAELEVGRTQLAAAEAQVKQAEAALQQAQLDLDHTYIRAPVDGVVVARNVDVGQTVAASLQAPTLFQIAQDLTKMQVDTNVSEADIGRIQVGQAATFTVDAYPGRVFHGVVSQIRQAPINVQNVVTYDAVITVSNPDLKLFPGMTANVKIITDTHRDVLKVPNAALRFRPPETAGGSKTPSRVAAAGKVASEQTIWLLGQDGKPRPVAVRAGVTDGNFTEVSGGGIKEGDRVIVASLPAKGAAGAGAAPLGQGVSRGPRF
jgi:HlyD family secretion protein